MVAGTEFIKIQVSDRFRILGFCVLLGRRDSILLVESEPAASFTSRYAVSPHKCPSVDLGRYTLSAALKLVLKCCAQWDHSILIYFNADYQASTRESSIMFSVLADTASILRRPASANNLTSNLTRGSGCTSTLDTASTGPGCCFFFVRLTADTITIGLSGRPFDACARVKNDSNACTLNLSAGCLYLPLTRPIPTLE